MRKGDVVCYTHNFNKKLCVKGILLRQHKEAWLHVTVGEDSQLQGDHIVSLRYATFQRVYNNALKRGIIIDTRRKLRI